jgi:DNA-binding MarR family transcriptional regulator
MSALAEQLGIARRSTTDIVGELVERGLAARVADPCDGRGVAVQLTGEGRALLDRLTAGRRAATESLLAGLTPAERHQLAGLLRHLLP